MANKSGRKSDELEFEDRMTRVYELMLWEHLSYDEFKNKAAKEFGITTRQAENLWKEARQRMRDRFSQTHEEVIDNHLTQMYDLLNRCRLEGNKLVERQVMSDLAKIYGAEKTKVDITSGGKPLSININLD